MYNQQHEVGSAIKAVKQMAMVMKVASKEPYPRYHPSAHRAHGNRGTKVDLDSMTMYDLVEIILKEKTDSQRSNFHEKLLQERLTEPKTLTKTSRHVLETKFGTNPNISYADLADIMTLRDAVADLQRQAKGNGKQGSARGSRRHC